MSELQVETWGEGTKVVLVHGSLAVGDEEWVEQRPLADRGVRLTVFDRRGYGKNAALADGEDFRRDAEDIAELMGDGAHLVGHSYGGLGVLCAAALRPEATLSLAVLEAGAFDLAAGYPDAEALVHDVREMWDSDLPDREWVVGFLKAVGSDPDTFPPEFLESAVPTVPTFRRGRLIWDAGLPLQEVAAGSFPKLVVSGGHHAAFEAICDALAERIGARREVVEGAGHEIQFTGAPLNALLLDLWGAAPSTRAPSA